MPNGPKRTMREPEVEQRVRDYLITQGYAVAERRDRFGPDIRAARNGRTLVIEVKGDRPGHQSSPATINVDVLTLLGQILTRRSDTPADEYAIGVRPVHRRLIDRVIPALSQLSIKVLLVDDDSVSDITSGQSVDADKEDDSLGAKHEALRLIQSLPDDCSTDDILGELYFKKQVDAGLRDVAEGRTISHGELRARIAQWRSSVGR